MTTLPTNSITYTILGIIAILLIILISKYNGMIKRRNMIKQAFADIDVHLKLRFDLIPNIIETITGYVTHEQQTLENLTKARTAFLHAETRDDKIVADGMLSGALKSMFAVAESYPDLKASVNFVKLQDELADVENKIAAARRFFNSTVQEYNTYIQIFPNNLVARVFGFTDEKSFEAAAGEKENIKVSF